MPSDKKEKKEQNVLISIDDVKKDFENFLNLNHNDRIFFSGMYGIGKTFFLREFFGEKDSPENDNEIDKEKKNSERSKYKIIHLYPVNYQIRENSIDIVELLKYDILIEFLYTERDTVKQILNEYADERDFCSFLSTHKKESLRTSIDFLSNLPDTISIVGKSLKIALGIHDAWKLFKEKEKIGLENFLEREKDKLKETDFLSQLIRDVNKRIEKEKQKQTILILDDLDRLDPDNIFRILNVFSAFFEKENENKFGFSKVIIVGDYENIKKIFHHKYGKETDFQGYMDKFFSIRPYFFENYFSVLMTIDNLLNKFKATIEIENVGVIKQVLKYFFIQSMKLRLVNLRKMLKPLKYKLTPLFYFKDGSEYVRKDYFNKSIELLIEIFDTEVNFLEVISKIENDIKQYEELLFVNHYEKFENEYYRTFFKGASFLMWSELKGQDLRNAYYYVESLKDSLRFRANLEQELIEPDKELNLERIFLAILKEYVRKELFWNR